MHACRARFDGCPRVLPPLPTPHPAVGLCAPLPPDLSLPPLTCVLMCSIRHTIAAAISTEARAEYNVGGLNGLTFFAPQLNMAANPLWGRNMECPGEDPYLSSVYAENYVKGFEGYGHPSGIKKAVTTPKHFVGQLFEGDASDPWRNGTTVNRQSNDTRYIF